MMLFVVSKSGPKGRKIVLLLSLLLVALFVAGAWAWQQRGGRPTSKAKPKPLPKDVPIDGNSAMDIVRRICDMGPRISDTPAMKKQQEFLTEHFKKLGATVSLQEFPAKHPMKGPVTLANLIVEFHPEATERILICCHYDTRPFPSEDPDIRKRETEGIFIGANDGASGVALLCEMGRVIPKIKCKYGIDFVFFDAEELIYRGPSVMDEGDPYFLGSKHFASEYKNNPPKHRYKWGVLVDLIGDANLELYHEEHSVNWPETKPLVKEIWGVAKKLGATEFIDRNYPKKWTVRDDHLPLYNDGGIPCIDIIDFAYPSLTSSVSYWHTMQDTPDKCSGRSIALVGWVLIEWLKSVK
jgi:glutaminyl-peptide cyclotransferase